MEAPADKTKLFSGNSVQIESRMEFFVESLKEQFHKRLFCDTELMATEDQKSGSAYLQSLLFYFHYHLFTENSQTNLL